MCSRTCRSACMPRRCWADGGRPAALHEAGLALLSALYGRDLARDNDLLPAIGFATLSKDRLQALARNGWAMNRRGTGEARDGNPALHRPPPALLGLLMLGVSIILFALINAIGNPIEILLAERPGSATR